MQTMVSLLGAGLGISREKHAGHSTSGLGLNKIAVALLRHGGINEGIPFRLQARFEEALADKAAHADV